MKVLFIVPYPTEGPSNRYRVEQFLPFLKERGIRYRLRPFISSGFYRIIYLKANTLRKIIYFVYSSIKRLLDIIRAINYDVIFVHIEAYPLGPPLFELLCFVVRKPIVFDFEDAIYLPAPSKSNLIRWLKNPGKFYTNLRLSSQVIVCNKHLKEKFIRYNHNIMVIPTSIDTDKFKLKDIRMASENLVLGWIGSHSTLPCLKQIFPVLQKLSQKYRFSLKIVGGGTDVNIPGINVINEKWTLGKDVENFQSLDIGLYPLPDNEWAMAKTPFKTIQYMAVGVVTVASCVGGNKEIIQDGVNGFLASNENEWIDKLSMLIENPELRRNIGIAGRKTVEEKYSLKVNAPKFLQVLNEAREAARS